MRTALHKQGVAVLVIPGDVALQHAGDATAGRWTEVLPPAIMPWRARSSGLRHCSPNLNA